MAGTSGREVRVAYARCNTWGTPASVTQQLLMNSTEGLDSEPILVDDNAFGQSWLAAADVGDQSPRTPDLTFRARFETLDVWLAAACGSVAAPTVVSSQAANSLVAYSHAITLANELTQFFTVAIEEEKYVLEVPSLKLRGFSFRIAEGGVYDVTFPIIGAKANYDSTVNTNSTVWGASAFNAGNRIFRKNTRLRMNLQSAGALGTADELTLVKEAAFTYARPLAGEDFVHNQDYIIEPDDDGFSDLMIEMTYARMSTVTANSLAIGLKNGDLWKFDWFSQGPYVNSTTRRSLLIEAPAVQLYSFRAPVVGQGQVRPIAQMRMKLAAAAPTGMTNLVDPFRMTLVNSNSATLL